MSDVPSNITDTSFFCCKFYAYRAEHFLIQLIKFGVRSAVFVPEKKLNLLYVFNLEGNCASFESF